MPWRETSNPYHIFISEIMLQQTQVDRVIDKYNFFIKEWPAVQDLSKASVREVLSLWSGLGYNRRALFLYKAAQIIVEKYHGQIPSSVEELDDLPGVGYNTAAAIITYAFNKPVVFIETNIRSVFIHEFFAEKENISDKEILSIAEESLFLKNPRRWYWALMDYGAFLKKSRVNPSRQSKHYSKQSSFKGSNREIRGALLKALLHKSMDNQEIVNNMPFASDKTEKTILQLLQEGFITQDEKGLYSVSS